MVQLSDLEIVVDLEAPTPLFAQLVKQVKEAVAAGQLEAGAALPSIRQLANDLGINAKTVAKAYRLLERDSIIRTRGYRGTFIHPDAKLNCSVDLNAMVTEGLELTVDALREAGATDSEIRIAFTKAMNRRAS